jgi:hypothetical protein
MEPEFLCGQRGIEGKIFWLEKLCTENKGNSKKLGKNENGGSVKSMWA